MASDCRWNVRVTEEDDRKLGDVIQARAAVTHEFVSATGTIRRAVHELWQRECNACLDD